MRDINQIRIEGWRKGPEEKKTTVPVGGSALLRREMSDVKIIPDALSPSITRHFRGPDRNSWSIRHSNSSPD